MDERLDSFLEHARAKGLDFQTTRELLRAEGWKDKDIAAAFAARELDKPVPAPTGTSTSRETFMYLASFAALYTWVIALIVLAFTYVNLAHPDPTHAYNTYRLDWAHASIRQSIAAILVAFPLFMLLWRSLLREVAVHPEKAHSVVRNTLTYISLFVAAATLVADAITLIYFLLEGELTTRFVLKVLALFVIVGAIFVYLGLTIRSRGPAGGKEAA